MSDNDTSYAKFLGQTANGMSQLAKVKEIVDGETGYFGEEVKATLVSAQDQVNHLFDTLNLLQRQVRDHEEEMKKEARKQGVLPLFPPSTAGSSNGNGSEPSHAVPGANGATHWQVYQHGGNSERYVVALRPATEEGATGDEVIGYVEIPAGGDLPEAESFPTLQFRSAPGVLEYLNAELEPWAVIASWGQTPAAAIIEEPKKGTKRKKKSSESGTADSPN